MRVAGAVALLAGLVPASISMIKRIAPPDMEARALSYGMTFGWTGMGGGPLLAVRVGPGLGLPSYFALGRGWFCCWCSWPACRCGPAPAGAS